MRTLMISVLVTILAFGFVFAVAPASAQDDLTLVCSAPVNGSALGVVPTAVTLTLSADIEAAVATVVDADGAALEDVETTVDGAVVTVTAPFAAGATYTVSLEETTVSITFSVAERAFPIGDNELVNDCPATTDTTEVPAVEATEAPVVEATEAPAVEATEVPAVEATEAPAVEATEAPAAVVLSDETYAGTSGDTNFTVNLPAEYVAEENATFFLFPVIVMASDSEAVSNYISFPDRLGEYVVIYTTFTSADLPTFGLTTEATAEEIVAALIRADSEVIEQTSVEVAGAPAVRVRFTNTQSGKDGIFYVIAFAGEDGTNYLLIQGSSESEDWAEHEAAFEALVASITVAE